MPTWEEVIGPPPGLMPETVRARLTIRALDDDGNVQTYPAVVEPSNFYPAPEPQLMTEDMAKRHELLSLIASHVAQVARQVEAEAPDRRRWVIGGEEPPEGVDVLTPVTGPGAGRNLLWRVPAGGWWFLGKDDPPSLLPSSGGWSWNRPSSARYVVEELGPDDLRSTAVMQPRRWMVGDAEPPPEVTTLRPVKGGHGSDRDDEESQLLLHRLSDGSWWYMFKGKPKSDLPDAEGWAWHGGPFGGQIVEEITE